MRILPLDYKRDISQGIQVEQFLMLSTGAIITTLPIFLLVPFFYLFTNRYKIVTDHDDEVDATACVIIGLVLGITVWAIFIIGGSLKG